MAMQLWSRDHAAGQDDLQQLQSWLKKLQMLSDHHVTLWLKGIREREGSLQA